MRIDDLVTAGLNETQASSYALLIRHGELTPPLLSKSLHLTRTNAYKVLDQLTDLGLARRSEVNKKFVYHPDNPLALNDLVAQQRNMATAQEEAVRRVMGDLLETYHRNTDKPDVSVVSGHAAVVEAYNNQLNLKKPVYFIRSRADIPTLGFETMHKIRTNPARHGQSRYGITPDITKGPVNPASDKRSGLDRTWVKQEDYTAPVEWSLCGPTLLIVIFGPEPQAVTIANPVITEAFLQLWKLLQASIKAMPYYKDLPRTPS